MASAKSQGVTRRKPKLFGFFSRIWNDIKLLADLISGTIKGAIDKLFGRDTEQPAMSLLPVMA